MTIEELYRVFLSHPGVQTDTRKLKKGDLFFALKGDNFNGNQFAAAAIEAGAAYAVIDDPSFAMEGKTILVENVLTSLQQLAKFHRSRFDIPVIAITGSNGKTTTKELVHAVLSRRWHTYTTEGNLNNHIGIPLTLLKIRPDAEIAVVEMGANHQKEIESYCTYTLPTHGIITNCGKAHLEGFGGVEGIRKGKGELFDYLRTRFGTAFIMRDYDYLRTMSNGLGQVISYGTADADYTGIVESSEPFLRVQMTGGPVTGSIHTQLVGDYNLPNVLVAVAVGHHFRVDPKDIISAIETYSPSNSRSQLVQKGSNTIILDAYNANPSSMKLAVDNFARLHADNKVLVLGAMAELGDESLAEHTALVEQITQHNWKAVLLVGGDFNRIKHPYHAFQDAAAAKQWLKEQQFEHAHWLVKGSRSMKMETILD